MKRRKPSESTPAGVPHLQEVGYTISYKKVVVTDAKLEKLKDEQEKAKQIKQAKVLAQQFYKLMSYRSFYKKVLGQKISDKKFGILLPENLQNHTLIQHYKFRFFTFCDKIGTE
jgi:hypothetical protein